MKKIDTWMPLYVGDYIADTMHLIGAEHGAYLLLLMHSWRTGALRDDERALAAVARTDPETFREMWPTLRNFFVPQDGAPSFLVSRRLERERERAAQHIDQRRAAGKASAAARARQRATNERSTGVALPLERESRPSPSRQRHALVHGLEHLRLGERRPLGAGDAHAHRPLPPRRSRRPHGVGDRLTA